MRIWSQVFFYVEERKYNTYKASLDWVSNIHGSGTEEMKKIWNECTQHVFRCHQLMDTMDNAVLNSDLLRRVGGIVPNILTDSQ